MKKGFTLIEVLVATFVIALGVGGLFSLVRQNSSFALTSSLQFQASFLAQEGVEIARNIRDANFLKIHAGQTANWDDNLTGCALGCEADYNDSALLAGDRFLNIANNMYTYDSGTPTVFKRAIHATAAGADALEITVHVSWFEKGNAKEVQASTMLYNWLEPSP